MKSIIIYCMFMLVTVMTVYGQGTMGDAYDMGVGWKGTSIGYTSYIGSESPSVSNFYYKFMLYESMDVEVSYSKRANDYIYIRLLSENGTVLKERYTGSDTGQESMLNYSSLPAGTYYLFLSGEFEVGETSGYVSFYAPRLVINAGEKSAPFIYTHTQNTTNGANSYGWRPTNDISYNFTLTKKMKVTISHCSSVLDDTYLSLLNTSGIRIAWNDNYSGEGHCSNTKHAYLEKVLDAGAYTAISQGYNQNGIITTTIKGELPKTEYDIGRKSGSFIYTHTQNTTDGFDCYGRSTNDVFYRFTITKKMNVTISHCGSTLDDTFLNLLDANGACIATNDNYSGEGHCSNIKHAYLKRELDAGTYIVVSEGYSQNGDITTTIEGVYTPVEDIHLGIGSSDNNYVVTRTYKNKEGTEYMDAIDYVDGLGRPLQTVQRKSTPMGKDLVTYQEYDIVGRKSETWLPVAISNGEIGAFVPKVAINSNITEVYPDETNPYSLPVYEASPLNRILEQYGPGTAWQSNSRSAKTAYLTNVLGNDTLNCMYYKVSDTLASADSVVTVTLAGNYATAELYVTRTADEDGNASFEFKDKLGQVVLTRQLVRNGSTKILHDTYYVYDDYGNLTAVLPPLASDNMNSGTSWTNANSAVLRNYAYLYMYDGRNRCKAKRLPGCAWTYYVYDMADRLIFSQDGRQRAAGKWSFTIPDIFDRVCITGICTGSYSALALTPPLDDVVVRATRSNTTDTYKGYASSFGITLTSPTVLSVNYYDDYAFIGSNGIDSGIAAYDAQTGFDTRYTVSAKTFLTGTLTAQLLPEGTVSPTYLYSVMYYDYKGRVIQTKGNNPLSGGTEKAYIAYNFTGQPLQKKHIHAATGKDTQTELYTYTYDDALRLKTTQYSLNKGTAVTLASNTYDELGRLLTTQRNGQSSLKTTYAYNVRSWLKSSSSPLFNQTLYYNDTYAGSTARYNGNISAMSWKMSDEIPTRGYKFSYDNLSRLTAANYLENGSTNDHFNTAYAYDKQGNMTSLARRGNTGTATYGDIDVLTMTYAGNQLVKAEDAGSSVSLSASMDFKNNSNAVKEYSYDTNGNLIQDLNKGINSITYNLLNLPQTLTISNPLGSATNSYTYAADGRKLKTVIGSKTTDYCGSVIYENGVLKRILVEGGYIEGGTYYFYLTDHLGNNRVVANASGTVVQTNHYYPFGMSFPEGAVSSPQPYKYNGKELDTDRGLNMYDYSARYMDPVLGRFNRVDPMAESYPWLSPYHYCANDPVLNIDPTGEDYWSTNNPDEIRRFFESQRYGSSSTFENFDFGSWTHVSDAEFTGNLSFNDKTNTFFTSYGAVENGIPIVIGISIKAANVWNGGASIEGARGKWNEKASGRVENVYPEFALFAFARGLLNLLPNSTSMINAKLPAGRSGNVLEEFTKGVTRNTSTTINGTKFTGHALDQMQNRGIISPTAVLDVIKNPSKIIPGNTLGTSVLFKDNLKVIINKTGDVISVIWQ